MDATEINLYKKQKRIFLMIILLIYSIILFIVLVMNLNIFDSTKHWSYTIDDQIA